MNRAVVAGGSLAGLLAARVLHEVADEVVIVEADEVSDTAGSRVGTPQAEHFHILLGMGQDLFGHWFPDLFDNLAGDGVIGYSTDDGRMFLDGAARMSVPGASVLPTPRPLLEAHVRREVAKLPGVRTVRGRVVGLTARLGKVDGVKLASGTSIAGADLVVDATGRASRLGDWLLRLDFVPPPKRRMELDLGYATRLFRRAPDQRLDDLVAVHSVRSAASAEPGVSAFAPAGLDHWLCTVSAYGGQRPTASSTEFEERCRREPAAGFAALTRECEPVGPVKVYRFPHSVRRDFHELERFPAGLAPVGDAVATFNPIYGQGMMSAALQASALSAWLRADENVHGYFTRLKVLVDAAWQTSVALDYALPHLAAHRPRGYRAMHAVSAAIDRATMTDPIVARRFVDVVNMRAHPSELLRPSMLARAFLATRETARPPEPRLRGRRTPGASDPAAECR